MDRPTRHRAHAARVLALAALGALAGCSGSGSLTAPRAEITLSAASVGADALTFTLRDGSTLVLRFDTMTCTAASCTASFRPEPLVGAEVTCRVDGDGVSCDLARAGGRGGTLELRADGSFHGRLDGTNGALDVAGTVTLSGGGAAWSFHASGDCVCDSAGSAALERR